MKIKCLDNCFKEAHRDESQGLRQSQREATRTTLSSEGFWAWFVECLRADMPRGVLKSNLPSKICATCQRPFTWRKLYEKVCSRFKHCFIFLCCTAISEWFRYTVCRYTFLVLSNAQCWDQVQCCSERCKNERKREKNRQNREARAGAARPDTE